MKHITLSALALTSALAFGTAAAAQTVIRVGHIQPSDHSIGIAVDEFARLVEERSAGAIDVEVHPNGEIGSSTQLAEGIRLGTVDAIITGTPYWSNFVPMLNVLDLPYLFESREHAFAVADGPIGAELFGLMEDHGVKALAAYEIGFRNITNNIRPVHTPADLAGLKMRVSPNKAHTTAFLELGANVVQMNFTEVFMALQTGAIDGEENPVDIIAAYRLDEVQKYMSITEHAYSLSLLAMNKNAFDRLTPDQQALVLQAAKDSATLQRRLNRETYDANLQHLKDAGMEVVENVDKGLFRDVVKGPVWTEFVTNNEGGQAFIDRILAATPQS